MCCDMGRSDRSDRKIVKRLFLWCCYNNARGEIFVYYEKKKGIRRVVIKIHKLEITGGLLHGKRCPFALQNASFCTFKEPYLADESNYNSFYYITISPTSNKDCIFAQQTIIVR